MPNCDWGKPCTCIDCRTKTFSIPCNSCGFKTTVSYEIGYGGGSTDRKGLFSYDFQERKEETSEIDCFKCGHHMTDVPYYEKIDVHINEYKLNEKSCAECGIKNSEAGLKIIQYREWKDKTLCLGCLEKRLVNEIPNPSNGEKKFKIDVNTTKYVLDKVMVPCVTCGRKRWLKADNQWRKQCTNCYKKALEV
ncbi:hypothetical protein GJU41_02960 [Bacillus idriensis]|uniref:Uncharacterized protein n=1 Tax=Metabacillus idriensis TaxID=324768 RepID=A0A6I2M918_9BACI|nr:hypothetical protein [Metabacillus idriensis]MRX52921.1 hypothetical protein [Metabacillus idriensis]